MIKWLKSLLSDTNPLRLAYHWMTGWSAALRFGLPARSLRVIGITGTDGKTTTVSMVSHILHFAGKKVGAVSTAFLEIDVERQPNPTQKTSLPAAVLQRFLQKLVSQGTEFAVIEVSSHGLVQSRFAGITFEVAAITNVAMEHLDYHGTMEEYTAAKAKLFSMLRPQGTKVLNADDETFARLATIPSARTFLYSPSKDLKGMHAEANRTRAAVMMDGEEHPIELPIPGVFNLANALCAIRCAQALGISPEKALEALRSFTPPPGRMERIDEGQPFSVYVDFTVTPQAFERTLSAAREMVAPGKRVLVLTGSCGNRMREKRPIIGRLCSELADMVVITDEEPYDEDPEAIIEEIWAGIDPKRVEARKILDRREAIRFILSKAEPGDIVLFCGLGSYPSRMMNGGPVPWNEQEIIREELKTLQAKRTSVSMR